MAPAAAPTAAPRAAPLTRSPLAGDGGGAAAACAPAGSNPDCCMAIAWHSLVSLACCSALCPFDGAKVGPCAQVVAVAVSVNSVVRTIAVGLMTAVSSQD